MNGGGSKRFQSTGLKVQESSAGDLNIENPEPLPEFTKEEYKDMVNTYGTPSDIWERPAFALQTGRRKKQEYSLAHPLVISPEQEDSPPFRKREELPPEDRKHHLQLRGLRKLLKRSPTKVPRDLIWRKYLSLRAPRLRYMSDVMIWSLFRHLAWRESKDDAVARQRYFSLLEECMGEQVPLTATEWSAAIHFAGNAVKNSTDVEVKDAIELWLRMEDEGVQANNVTFNVLFYVAIKAGRFALAETIRKELISRGMELDRYFRITNIYYAGIRGNGDAVRRAFNEMVNADEVVDTSVMNCVILSLMRAGESSAAEHVFLKMKALHESKFGSKSPNDWRSQRELAQLLNKTGKLLRKEGYLHQSSFFGANFSDKDRRERIQEATPIAPNSRTYRLLLRYHTRVSGELERVKELLSECNELGLQLHGSVYMNVFAAFVIHGGFVHSAWKPSVLEYFWRDFLEASSASQGGYHLSTGSDPFQTPDFDAEHHRDDGESYQDYNAKLAGLEASLETEEADLAGHFEISEEDKPPYITVSMATVILRAFHKCIGTPRTLEVWDDMKDRWKYRGPDETEAVENLLATLSRFDS